MSQVICQNCGTVGRPKKHVKGSILIELLLWLIFLITIIIYCNTQDINDFYGSLMDSVTDRQNHQNDDLSVFYDIMRLDSTDKKSILIELLLLLIFLIPGITYTMWRLTTRTKVCRGCGEENILPLNSPVGRKLQNNLK